MRQPIWPPPTVERRGKVYLRLRVEGKVKETCLGVAGSAEARAEYLRRVAEMEQLRAGASPAPDVVVNEGVAAHLVWAGGRHCCRQYDRIRRGLRPVAALYGHTLLSGFGPLAFAACRAQHEAAGHCRAYVNALAGCIRRWLKWCSGKEWIPAAQSQGLYNVPDLRKRETTAPERPPVRAVDRSIVLATLPHLRPIPRAMVELLLLTGVRPGEVCLLRPCDLVRPWQVVDGVEVWLFRLDCHKNDWRGQLREIPLGPRAQALLLPYLDRPPGFYCFSPRESRAAQERERSKPRPVPVPRKEGHKKPGRKPKGKPKPPALPRGMPGERYTTQSLGKAVRCAAKAAGVASWALNQVRHRVATDVQTAEGRESARCLLGHDNPSTTAIYAESTERAARWAARMG